MVLIQDESSGTWTCVLQMIGPSGGAVHPVELQHVPHVGRRIEIDQRGDPFSSLARSDGDRGRLAKLLKLENRLRHVSAVFRCLILHRLCLWAEGGGCN